VRLIWR